METLKMGKKAKSKVLGDGQNRKAQWDFILPCFRRNFLKAFFL